jgi:hypothetical protein
MLGAKLKESWPAWVLAGRGHGEPPPITIRLRVGVASEIGYERLGYTAVQRWRETWEEPLADGLTLVRSAVRAGGPLDPVSMRVDDLRAAITFAGVVAPDAVRDLPDVGAAADLADRLVRVGATLTPASLRKACALPPADQRVLIEFAAWLSEHDDVSAYTRTQLPVPEAHTKWLTASRMTLLRELTGRDLATELRTRQPVVHFSYLDPDHLAGGQRRHDSWTAGDVHQPAYVPNTVVIVENRDCRLFFPTVPRAIAVEGGGDAADALLDRIPWVTGADTVVYWGDLDADGFAILARLRAAFCALGVEVPSILMDAATLDRFAHLHAATDRHGKPIGPRGGALAGLDAGEEEAYRRVATSGDVPVRRIEQEKLLHALEPGELAALVTAPRSPRPGRTMLT